MDLQIKFPKLKAKTFAKAFAKNLGLRVHSRLRKTFDTAKDKVTNIFNKSTPTPAPKQPPA